MTDKEEFDAKLKKFVRFIFLAIFLVGLVGGWFIYHNTAPGTKIYGIQLLMPTIGAAIVMVIAMVLMKKKMFGSKEEFQAAVKRFENQNK